MIAALKSRGFARLWCGDVVSMIGDWLTYVAVGVLAIEQGGALAVLGVLLAHTVPRALVAPWAGRLADLHDRRAVLVAGSLARGLAVVGMAVAAGQGATGWVQGLLAVRMALGAFVDAASGAAVPRLVPAGRLASAHALLGVSWSVVFGVGVAAGGLLTAALGPEGALWLDALTFGVAALLFAGLPALPPRPARAGEPTAHDGWGAVWGHVRARPALRRAVLAKVPVMIANGGAFVLAHAVAGARTGAAVALTLGGLHLARALGTGLGPALWVRVAALHGTETGLRVATGVVLLGVVLFAGAGSWPLQGLGALLWGVGVGAHWVTAATRVQQLGPDPLRGRLTAIDLVAHTAGQGLGGALGTVTVAWVLAPGLAVGLGVVAVALASWAVIERGARGASRAPR
ncbi:MAG: MFS transporter [Myxococcales bacterium]|nr:MFS transporter [Myxococcales bacterium]